MTVKLFDSMLRLADAAQAAGSLAAHWIGQYALLEPAIAQSQTLPPKLLDVAKDLGIRTPFCVIDVISMINWLRPDPCQHQAEWDAWIVRLHAGGYIEQRVIQFGLGIVESMLHNLGMDLGYYEARRPSVSPIYSEHPIKCRMVLGPPDVDSPRARVDLGVLRSVEGMACLPAPSFAEEIGS